MVSREVHEVALTASKPDYDEEGLIIPKIFVYQQTNGLFSKCFGSQM